MQFNTTAPVLERPNGKLWGLIMVQFTGFRTNNYCSLHHFQKIEDYFSAMGQ